MPDNVSDTALIAGPAPAMTLAPDSVAAPASVREANQSKSGSVNIDDGSKPDEWPRPIREDLVKNAVTFLSHPKVRESAIKNRFLFLEQKGLTRAEIEEAFRRCPDPSTNDAAKKIILSEGRLPAMPSKEKPGGYQQAVVSAQPQVAPQYTKSLPGSALPVRSGLHWWRLIMGAGCIAAAGAGTGYFFQKVLAPKLKSLLRDILLNEDKHKELKGEGQSKVPKLSPLEEVVAAAVGAANAAAAAASVAANTSREVIKLQAEEWQHVKSLMKALDNKTEDLKSTIRAMGKANLENTSYYKVEGMAKPYERFSSAAEQLHTKQSLQGYQVHHT
ncbi:hypothetical protein KP509_34G019400 [Ceratopteris richardii]|uniref:Peroxisomal membrane protein PEX14 n=1 Tax=Ceratopteris richardii TaxID=49495 RepID=A0A8T2QIS9_CERRI|nr:hypothetical protein KP509_34G019400 [Ceratopteris richardii]